MGGTFMRKMMVLSKIAQLPNKEEREKAFRLYGILDQVEWFTWGAPSLFGGFCIIILMIFVMIFLKEELISKLPGGTSAKYLWGVASGAICLVIGIIGSKIFYFNPRLNRKVDELRSMLYSDSSFVKTLETLKEFDPDMARNIRRYILQAT